MDYTPPTDIDAWLDERADELGVGREMIITELIDTYRDEERANTGLARASGATGDDIPAEIQRDVLEAILRRQIEERIDQQIDETLATRLEDRVDDRLEELADERIRERARDVLREEFDEYVEGSDPVDALDAQLRSLRSEYEEALGDVRERIIQVKKEADGKTPTEDHQALAEQLESMERSLEELATELRTAGEEREDRFEEQLGDTREELSALGEEVDAMSERLEKVGWALGTLREESERRDRLERIKEAAANLHVSTAECERCEQPVDVAMLGEPACPHCSTELRDLNASRSLFGLFEDTTLLAAE